jgi:hypothetical protein
MAALKKRFGFDDYDALVDRACKKDPRALEALNYEADCLPARSRTRRNLFDLDSIILYGEFQLRPQLLISKVREQISERSAAKRSHDVAVIPSGLENGASVSASTAAIISAFFQSGNQIIRDTDWDTGELRLWRSYLEKNYSKAEILERTPNISQLAGIKPYVLSEGKGSG